MVLSALAVIPIAAYIYTRKKEQENKNVSEFNLGTLSSGFNNLSSGVINWFDDTRENIGGLLSPIQDDIGSIASGVSNSTSNFFSNIWDIFPFGGIGANATENQPTDYSQFGTPENPTGYYVVSPEIGQVLDNQNSGGGETGGGFFGGFRDRFSGFVGNIGDRI